MTRNEFIKRVGYLKRYAPNGMDHYAPAYKHVQIENKAVIAGLKKFYNDHINTNPEILFNVRLATFIPTNLAAFGKKQPKTQIVTHLTKNAGGGKCYVLTKRKTGIRYRCTVDVLLINDYAY